MCDGLGLNKILRADKKSGPVLSRLCTKVHETFGQCRPFVLSNAFARLFISRFTQKIFAIKSSIQVVEKPNKCKSFLAPSFSWGTIPTVLQHIVSAIYDPPFGKLVDFYRVSICEGGLGSRNSVRPSVRLSHTCIVTKPNNALQIFLYHTKGQSLCYSGTKSGWSATPPSL